MYRAVGNWKTRGAFKVAHGNVRHILDLYFIFLIPWYTNLSNSLRTKDTTRVEAIEATVLKLVGHVFKKLVLLVEASLMMLEG